MRFAFDLGLTGLALFATLTNAIDIDLDSRQSILDASKIVADNLIAEYNATAAVPGGIPGLLPQPYYFWNAGYMWNGLIKYWALSGDDSVVPTITEALLFQVGPDQNYMPPNQSKSLGNDDQAAWGLAAMSAAEYGFPNPSNESITWAGLADAVFQSQVLRWDETSCGGGLKWQIFTFNNGYNYKNSVSQGSLAQLAARLGRYTGNSNYSDWATRVVEWTRSVGLISNTGSVYDGTDDNLNCTELNHIQWTLNSGMFITAGAYSANATALDSASGQYWSELNQQLLDAALRVFVYEDTDIVFEVACEPSMNCNTDQQGFRAGFVRSLATLRDLAPAEDDRVPRDAIGQVLRASATAAAAACTEGNGTTCALNWYEPTTDDFSGSNYHINQNLNALEVFLANLPVGEIKTGSVSENGTSAGGSDTGIDASGSENDTSSAPASTGSGTGAASSVMVSSMLTVAGLFAAMLVVV